MPIVKLVGPYVVVSPPGTSVNAFGHKFVIQENGEAHADIDAAFVATEVAAGRVQLVSGKIFSGPAIPAQAKMPVEFKTQPDPEPPNQTIPTTPANFITEMFQGTAADYFGYKNLQALNEKVRSLSKPEIKLFANLCARIETPAEMGKSTMIIRSCAAVDEMAKKMASPEVSGEEA